jgi:signal transduction histidine kinase
MIDIPTLIRGLGQNVALVLSLAFIYSRILPYLKSLSSMQKNLVIGFIFGITAIFGIMLHIEIAQGITIDGRFIVVAISGLLGGPVSALISGILASVYRIMFQPLPSNMDGIYAAMIAVGIIMTSALIGTLFHKYSKNQLHQIKPKLALMLGAAVAVNVSVGVLFIPSVGYAVFQVIFLPSIILFPIGTLLILMLIGNEYKKIFAEGLLSQSKNELKEAHHKQEILIKNLETKNAELERFTYTVSHDLKSPLITIKGFLGMLTNDAVEGNIDRMKSDIDRISNAADKMQALLEELLELSRIGRITNQPTSAPFQDLAEKTVNTLAGRLKEKNIEVEIDASPVEITGDMTRLSEVMQNLVDNAAKFSGDRAPAKIHIGTRQEDDNTIYFVKDNGVGIKAVYHKKIFGLFDKLDQAVEGTGIGLAIVKRVIEVHGGRIWVESAGEGKGSAFYFTIGDISNENSLQDG